MVSVVIGGPRPVLASVAAIVEDVLRADTRLVTTNLVVAETHALLLHRTVARGGSIEFRSFATELEITMSDGVRSLKSKVRPR